MNSTARYLHLVGATGTIRAAQLDGRDHIVVPVVALVEGVIWAMNAEKPEMVFAETFAKMPGGWNSKPVFAGHPKIYGDPVSGGVPDIYETRIGQIFNTSVDGKKLKMEAWLDTSRMLSEQQQRVLSRVQSGEMIEVSVGAFVISKDQKGIHNGKSYSLVWEEIAPDHLALLDVDETGACSIAAGCGTPRAAMKHLISRDTITIQGDTPMLKVASEKKSHAFIERMLRAFSTQLQTAEGMSDQDVRNALDTVLRASEPGYYWIETVFPEESQVVYSVGLADGYQSIRRSYTLADGVATLSDDRDMVTAVVRYEPVTAEGNPDTLPATAPVAATETPCKCGGHTTPATLTDHTQENKDMTKTERIAALIGKSKTLTAADAKWLETVPDDRLSVFEAEAETPAPVETPVVAPIVETPAPVTAEAYIASAPVEIRDVLRQSLRAASEHKAAVIAALKATGRCLFSDAALNAMPTDQLETLSALADVPKVDFSGRGLPRVASENEGVPEPVDFHASIRAAAKK